MELSQTESIWNEIDSSKRETRLVEIEPSNDFDAEICCRLRVVSLNHDPLPQYLALSYACGGALSTERISVNSATLAVTSHLERALRYLRKSDESVVFWIDAVSINQDDTTEKMQQIRLMSYIYRCAATVCIWLGESSESSSLGMSLLGGVEGDYFDWLREQPLNADHVLKYAQALEDILSRPWWSRLWPAQEFALAPASVFMCGSHWFDSEQLVKDDDLTSMIGTLNGNGLSDDLSMSLHDLQANSFTQTTTIKALWHHMSSQTPSKKAENFLEILKRCAGRHCFDDRDRVFALLGLSPEPVAWSVNANYDNSVPEVYEDLAANVIRHFDSLAVLITAGLGLQTEPDLPSWVPDWRNSNMLVQPRWYGECGSTFSAFANKRHAWACGDNQLRVKGVRLGTIPSVGLGVVCKPMLNSFMADYEIEFRRALRSWTGLCDVVTREGGMESYLNGSCKAEAFYRTVYGDVKSTMYPGGYTTHVRLQTSDVQAMVSNVDWAERLGRYDGERIGPEGRHVPPYVGARRLFVTDTGYFGNGGPSVEPGDEVFILMGCDYPAILRPMDSTPQCTMYKLVETCYVHGVMDGELFEGASLFEVPEFLEEDDIRTYLAWVEKLGDHVIEPVWLC